LGGMRVVIAEDSGILREGLAQLLAVRGHEVVAAVADAEALREAVHEHQPDVAVIDIRLPPDNVDSGLRAAIELRRALPELGVLVFSQYVERSYAADLLADGAVGVGYLLKERVVDLDDFIDALHRVAAGGTALDPEVVALLVGSSKRHDRLDELTPREREVLALMAQGRANAAIAGTMGVTERAVEKHIANIFGKLGLLPSSGDHRRVLAVLRYLEG
jgi:DNA-binding NarL/FixJ family response regulator